MGVKLTRLLVGTGPLKVLRERDVAIKDVSMIRPPQESQRVVFETQDYELRQQSYCG